MKLIKGNFIEAKRLGELTITEQGYLALENGRVKGLYPVLPAALGGAPVEDMGDALILQGFCDLHLHAPQYPMLGLGMDLPLMDWLDTYAFPTESAFSDTEYAREVYRALARKLIENGTTRVSVFGSRHTDATLILMEELENAGLSGFAGKVNMDTGGGPLLQETTEQSRTETLRWLDGCDGFTHIRPILTPRFTPSCSDGLMVFLGALARERGLRVQSHLSENRQEIELVKTLHPDCAQYWQTYEKYGLLNEYTLMAHCVYADAREQEALKARGAYAVHCADSNINICSGLAPVKEMLERGVHVALGSDIAGGSQLSMLEVMTASLRASKAKRIESGWQTPILTVAEAYYLATTAGAGYFGAGAGFAVDEPLHAVVLNEDGFPPAKNLTLTQRFERAIYLGKEKHIQAVFADGRRVK